jgi:hypothetical protein
MSVLIRPVASLDELARAFDAIGAQLPQRLTSADRRFSDLARRFSEDRSLMLIATEGDRVLGGALAFRRDESGARCV